METTQNNDPNKILDDLNKRLRLAVADLLAAAPGVDPAAKTEDQMDLLDMIFRKLAASGARFESTSSYLAALKAQAQFRQMIGARNTLKRHETGLPPTKNPWRTNY